MRHPPLDPERRAAGPRLDPLEHRAAVDPGLGDDQVVEVPAALVFGVAEGALDDGFEQPGAAVREEPQQFAALRPRSCRGSSAANGRIFRGPTSAYRCLAL